MTVPWWKRTTEVLDEDTEARELLRDEDLPVNEKTMARARAAVRFMERFRAQKEH